MDRVQAVRFLKELNFDDDSDSDSGSSASSSGEQKTKQQEKLQTKQKKKQPLAKKRRRPESESESSDQELEKKPPARAARKKKQPTSEEKEEKKRPARPARKQKDDDGDDKLAKRKEQQEKKRLREKARRDHIAEDKRQMQGQDRKKVLKEKDNQEGGEEDAPAKTKEVAKKAKEDKDATKRKARTDKLDDGAATKKKEKAAEDAPRKSDEPKPAVTPSPSRKRARVSSSSSIASSGSNEPAKVLTEDEKAKKALRKYRMDRMRNRREKQLENKQAKKALHRAMEERDALLTQKQSEKGDSDVVDKEKQNEDGVVDNKSRPLKKRRRIDGGAEVTKDASIQNTPSSGDAIKAHHTDKEGDDTKDESPMSTSNDADSEPQLHTEAVQEENAVTKPSSPEEDPEDGEIHEDTPLAKDESPVKEDSDDTNSTNVKNEKSGDEKVEDEADMPIPKKSSSKLNALANLPIPRKPRNPGEGAASFVIPKRPASATSNTDGADGAVNLSTSRMVRKPRAPLPDILKAVVNAAPSALVRPSRPRTKQVVPSEVTKLGPAEKTFVITARKRHSLLAASLSLEEFARGPTPYEVFDGDGTVMADLTPRMMCPMLRDLSTNRDEYPSTYFGVGLASPKGKITTNQNDIGTKSENPASAPAALNCYEPLKFLRPEDRDSYQRKMYGTTFVPQLIKGHTTLVMRNAKYERKSRGIRFNSDRDREDFQQVLSKRFKKNKSTPVCEIPRESWRKMMVDQRPGIVYLHFYNREDAMLAALEFVDDLGVPLEWKREYRAGVVLTANVNSTTPRSAPERSPSNDRGLAPAASPNDSQHGSDRDRGRQFHRGRGRNWNGDQRGPPHRLQSHYGEQQVMQRSPAELGGGQRASYMTPTGRNDRDRESDRSKHPHHRARSSPRSRSRSQSMHGSTVDGPMDAKTASSTANGNSTNQHGSAEEESKGLATQASQDSVKSDVGSSTVPNASSSRQEGNQMPADASVPGNMPSKDQSNNYPNGSDNQRQPSQSYSNNYDARGGHYGNHSSNNDRESWRGNDGHQRFGRRSRSRSRPRNQEQRRDWGRDDRGSHAPPDYDHRHTNGMYHDDRGRGGYGGNERYGRQPPPPPPPLPGDAPYHHDRRWY